MTRSNLHKSRKFFSFTDKIHGCAGKMTDRLEILSRTRARAIGAGMDQRLWVGGLITHAANQSWKRRRWRSAGLCGTIGLAPLETGPRIGNSNAAIADASALLFAAGRNTPQSCQIKRVAPSYPPGGDRRAAADGAPATVGSGSSLLLGAPCRNDRAITVVRQENRQGLSHRRPEAKGLVDDVRFNDHGCMLRGW